MRYARIPTRPSRRQIRCLKKGEARVQERKQKLLRRNLEFVFCLTISKSQGEARNLESGRPEPVLGICSTPKIRGEARNLDRGSWMVRATFLENASRQPEGGRCGNSETRKLFFAPLANLRGDAAETRKLFFAPLANLRGGAAETRKLFFAPLANLRGGAAETRKLFFAPLAPTSKGGRCGNSETRKLFFAQKNAGTPESGQPPALSLTVQCVRLPPVLLNRYRSILFFFLRLVETRNLGKWKLRSLYR